MRATRRMHRKQSTWLATRKKYVTSSDAAIIMGVGYSDPFTLYHQKKGNLPPLEDRLRFRVGHAIEPLVASELSMRRGLKLVDPGGRTMFISDDFDFLAATPDRLVLNNEGTEFDAIAEIKSAHGALKKIWEAGPSDYALVQVIHQMLTLGIDWAYAAALVGLDTYMDHLVGIDQHANLADAVLDACDGFHKCLRTNTPPPMDWRARPTLMQLFNRSDETTIFIPPADGWVSKARSWRELQVAKAELKASIKAIDKDLDGLAVDFMGEMGEAEKLEIEGVAVATWKTQERREYTVHAKTIRPFRMKVEEEES